MADNPYPSIVEIKARAEKIGLSLAELARDAGIARSTIFQIGRGRDPHVGTISSIVDCLERRELAQRDHLVALHGVPSKRSEVA